MPLSAPPQDFTWTPGKIKELRLSFSETQKEFGSVIGVHQGIVSSWERGVLQPRGASLTILTLIALKSDFFADTEYMER